MVKIDSEGLIKTVEDILSSGVARVGPEFDVRQSPERLRLWEACRSGVPEASLAPLLAKLCQEPALQKFSREMLQHGWSSAGSVSFNQLAEWLIAASDRNGARATVLEFDRFLQTNEATAWTVFVIHGVSVGETIELTEDISIMPLLELPPSVGLASLPLLWGQPNPLARINVTDVAALVFKDRFFSPVMRPWTFKLPAFDSDDMNQLRRRNETLNDVLRCLTVVGPASLVSLMQWCQSVGPGVPITDSGGYSFHETASIRPLRLGPFCPKEARAVVSGFYNLPPDVRHDLRVPLDRLGRAIRPGAMADQATDLGIALEAILFHGHGSTAELTFRMSLRGAWLAGSAEADRLEKYTLLKRLYELRSKAVHTGDLPPSKVKENHALVTRGIHLCSDLLAGIIKGGRWPNTPEEWNKLVLGL